APGDAIMQLNVAVHVNLVGLGTFRVEDLISEEDGHWFVINSYGNALNDSRQIAVQATNPTTGESGAILLTPDGSALAAGSIANPTRLSVAPNPFRDGTTIHFDASGEYPARITIHDVTGRVLRTFSGGDALRNGSIAWDGRDEESRELASGVYFAKITNGSEVEMQKVVKLK
ncbi:MAG TPA: T9SS type A sorting domain-containing protein, partial [bacterium]|nr:T9SS type A sorting domain-containing protein [bacterium]